ncbi:MAG TPA: toll/interleukin-1 receptor domain-containing protein, partial [bacterium]|nr:toll/interleukin-1 receptor domain-containing protein [bacterium]
MGREEYLARLTQGVSAWNDWRRQYPDVVPVFEGADLRGLNLMRVNLRGADLRHVNLEGTYLIWADLAGADLRWANLTRAHLISASLNQAYLFQANLHSAVLTEADCTGAVLNEADLSETNLVDLKFCDAILSDASLIWANLVGADLSRCALDGAHLFETIFNNACLTGAMGLTSCIHHGPSTLDHRTIVKSGSLPLPFLRGCGLPDELIEHYQSPSYQKARFRSCFFVHSQKDEAFVQRLSSDLQNRGIRCWPAPKDALIEENIRDAVGEAIHAHDKLIFVMSENSVHSDWFGKEISRVLERETKQK